MNILNHLKPAPRSYAEFTQTLGKVYLSDIYAA